MSKMTILTDITDSELFKLYWLPLVCKYREVNFIFANSKGIEYPSMFDWSNVKFGPHHSRDELVKEVKTSAVYLTYQNEIPTYQLMTILREGKTGVGTTNGRSFSVSKENWQKSEIKERYMTYLIEEESV